MDMTTEYGISFWVDSTREWVSLGTTSVAEDAPEMLSLAMKVYLLPRIGPDALANAISHGFRTKLMECATEAGLVNLGTMLKEPQRDGQCLRIMEIHSGGVKTLVLRAVYGSKGWIYQ